MALSNSQYNAVMRGYEERQRLQRRAMEARTQEVYKKIPQIQELDRQISSRAADCARRVLGGDTKAREHLKEDLADLKGQPFLVKGETAGVGSKEWLSIPAGMTICKSTWSPAI